MASNGVGLTETVVFAPPVIGGAPYKYRTGMGMINSAEWSVWMDDFVNNAAVGTNIPHGWKAAIIDAGATVTANTTAALGANGVIQPFDATASEGASIYGEKVYQLTAAKKFFMEVRVRTDDVTDNAVQFGLAVLTATTNPEDLWLTAQDSFVAMGIVDGAGTTTLFADKTNSGSTVETGTRAMVADTWHTLAIYYDGASLSSYLDGYLTKTWAQAAATTVPVGIAMAPFIGHINGNGAGGNVVLFDYVRIVSQR